MPNNFNQYQPYTGFNTTDSNTGDAQDLGERYISKSYLLEVYPNLVPGRYAGGLYTWGENGNGQLGRAIDGGDGGAAPSVSSPVQVGSLTTWAYIGGGGLVTDISGDGIIYPGHTLGITTSGALWAWGKNNRGQLGLGDTVHRSSPVQVGALTNWKQVAGGGDFSIAVKTDGSLWSWGDGYLGVLGSGSETDRSSPVQVGTLTNWKYIAVGEFHVLSVKTNGTLWSWGEGGQGRLGSGAVTDRSSPVQVGTLANWKQVAAGLQHSAAVKTDGTLWTWGFNLSGQLGDGTQTARSSPVQVGTLTNWKQVSIGHVGSSTYAIKTDGTLWAWGFNLSGQLGLGDRTARSSPVQVGSLTNWKYVSGGEYFAMAIKTDGTLWAWGENRAEAKTLNSDGGYLGDGTLIARSSPVQIGSLTNWKFVNNFANHSAGITSTLI